MEKFIDLHVHSCYSDGEHTPGELIDIAKNNDVRTISITDHDTVLAYQNLIADNDVEVIPGIELSAKDEIGRTHILGYGIDPFNKEILEQTERLKENSIESFLMIVEYLKNKGVIFNSKDISYLINREGDVGRPDLAKLCIDYGYSESVDDAFRQYLIEAYLATKSKRSSLTYQECFELIKKAGGIPVLAHPISLNRNKEDMDALIKDMVKEGLMGLEVFHSNHSIEQMSEYLRLAQKYNLLYSGGSDYHGEIIKPDIEMGKGRQKNLHLTNCTVLDYLKNRWYSIFLIFIGKKMAKYIAFIYKTWYSLIVSKIAY